MNPLTDAQHALILQQIKVGVSEYLTTDRMRLTSEKDTFTLTADLLRLKLETFVLAENLPPQAFHVRTADPRWATWWDHLKATVRDRWWARRFVARFPPCTVDTPVDVTVDVHGMWTYPNTPHLRPPHLRPPELGLPVFQTQTSWRDGLL
jgi:hypothetical protein